MNAFLFDKTNIRPTYTSGGDLQGAEIDDAVLHACQSYPVEDMLRIRNVVIDKRDVQSADLRDTDSARISIFGNKLGAILGFNEHSVSRFLAPIKVVRIVDPSSTATQVLEERVSRTRTGRFNHESESVFDVEKASEFIGINVSEVSKLLSLLKDAANVNEKVQETSTMVDLMIRQKHKQIIQCKYTGPIPR